MIATNFSHAVGPGCARAAPISMLSDMCLLAMFIKNNTVYGWRCHLRLHPPFCLGWTNRPVHDLPVSSSNLILTRRLYSGIRKTILWFVGLQNWFLVLSPSKFFVEVNFMAVGFEITYQYCKRRQQKDKTPTQNDMGYNVKINFSQKPAAFCHFCKMTQQTKAIVMACTQSPPHLLAYVVELHHRRLPHMLLCSSRGCSFFCCGRMPTPKGFRGTKDHHLGQHCWF